MIGVLTIRWARPLNRIRGFAGPLFDKELRVSSRRRRVYALRFAYVVLLSFYITMIWIPHVRFGGELAAQRARMAMAAKQITRGIVWFQFIAVQLVAVVTMSTAISEEVYGRTLAVLMTTPLSSLQVVASKLLSRLAQIVLLIAMSLPLLAIVRVLGGIPWDYLILSLSITVAAVVFVSAISLFFSVLCRRGYVAVIVSFVCVGSLFAFLPFVSLIVTEGHVDDQELLQMLSYLNPFVLLEACTEYMISPGRSAKVPLLSLISCMTMLLVSAGFLLASSAYLVRLVALRRAMGQATGLTRLHRSALTDNRAGGLLRRHSRGIRRVVGPPMIWKELVCALSRRQKLAVALAIGIEILLVFVAYTFPPIMAVVGYEATHMLYIWVFLTLGVLFTLSVSATMISSERESRTWPVLLVTPLTDRDILLGKVVGVLRRCGPVWLPLWAYVAAFSWAKCFHPLAILHATVITVSVVVFLSATGLYFGSRCHRTSEAVTANLVLIGLLWFVLPLMGHLVAVALYGRWGHGEAFTAVPFAQACWMVVTALDGGEGDFRWFGTNVDAADAMWLMLACLVGYVLVAHLFAGRAVRAFRRRII